MTDPLSVSASVAGLVSLADVVFSKVFRYAKAVKDAESDIALLAEKTQALSGVLHSLFRLSLELDDQDARREIRHRHFESCGRILQRIKQALEGREPSAKNGLANSIKIKLSWPFSSSETKKLVDQISGLHTEISQSMNADSMHRLLQSLSTQTEIRNELGKINDEIEKLNSETKRRWEFETRISMDDHRRKVLDFFGSVDPSSNHDTSLKLRHPLTGLWLIEHGAFKQWLDIPGSKLWLSGIPGAGKTVLASLVVEEALKQSSSRRAVAYFYCDYKDQNRQDPVKILGAIAAQISRQDESQESFEKLEKYYVECHPKGRGPRRPEAQRLLDLIREMCRSSFDEASIVVDALDECGENQVPVVNILQKLNGDKFSRISTLFLSRDEHHLRSRLEKTYAHIPIAAHTDDLQLYVAAEVELRIEEGRLHEPNPALKAEIVECLVNKADGMFRWVTCQLDDLCRSRTDSALRKALRSLPTTLSETYERILERVNQCGTDEQELVEYTLRWLLFAPRMDIAALCEALAIKDGSNQLNHEDVPGLGDILILCSSLVRKSVKGDYLEISHFTVEEFLLSIDPIRRKNLVRYHMDRKAAVVKLSIQRLTYLTWTDFSLKLANSLEEMDERWRRYPFRKFAVDAFSVCREGWDDQRVLDKAKVLLSPTKTHNFLSWAQEKVIRSSLRHGDRFLHGPSSFKRLTSAIASGSMGPLHFAAMFRIPEIVQWLLDMGCEANQMSDFGTPVHCVLTGIDGYGQKCQPWEARSETALKPILQMLFASGATCSHNLYAHELPWRTNHRSISVMGIVLDMNCTDEYERKLISELVSLVGDFGGRLEEHELSILEWRMQDPSAMELVVRAISDDWIPARLTDWYTKLKIQLELQLKVQEIGDEGPEPGEPEELQESIWEAAAHDQESVLQDLLKRPGIDIDAADDSGQSALHRATSQGSVRAMRILLGSGASVHKVDQMRQTPLHKCSSNRNTQGLTLILEAGANPGAIDESGCNVWHLAAKENNPEILEALTLLDSDWKEALRATCFRGFTPLVHAANSDSLESLSFLIERTEGWKADPTFADAFIALPCHKSTRRFQEYLGQFWDSILQTNDFDVRAMEYAIKQNNVDLVRSLLSRGTCTHDATKKDSRPTPLELACSKNCCDAIFELIVENTRIDEPFQERASYGQGLVHRLCSEEKLLRVDRLRQVRLRGMDINLLDCFGKTALMNAAENNKPELLAALLENNADPGITAGDGWNFLHFAASSGSKSCFEVLDRFEIPPYVWTAWTERSRFRHRDELSSEFSDPSPKSTSRFSRKSYSQSIMHLAVVHPQLLQYLLVKGIFEVDCRAENEYTPLHEAVDMDQIDSARSLIRHGANFNATTKAGRTPLHFASGRDGSLFAYLMGCGADPRVSDRNGNLPIHVAASRGRNYIVSVLLEAGPIDVKNHDGMTPELCALAAGHNYTANLINKTSQNHGQ
ncbi:ankyrin repeat-containing domain protein [Phyllosticta citribraziliensis]|uniref:Ankyrin repeat-containing domain protein n=1 Tax=Phyllosticta citribraziliensis TaxID=989973 RepID=A0ABR1L432_9PEZI